MRRFGMVVAAWLVVSVATNASALTPVKVLGGPENQYYGHSNGTYLGWSQNSTSAPKFYNAWIMDEATERRTKLNPKGTEAFFGGFEPGGTRAILQLIDDGRSDVKLYDLAAKTLKPAPQGVNSRDWEWAPRVSSGYVLFMRDDNQSPATWLLLLNRANGKVKQLAKVDRRQAFLRSDSVGERYATWQRCDATTCKAYVFDTQMGTTKVIPSTNGLPQYGSSLDEARGWVYVVRSGNACGKNVAILRFSLTDLRATPEKLASLPSGIDVFDTSVAVREADGRVDLMLSRAVCAKDQYADIYALRGVDTLTG
jgi:hypothetical protein